MDMRILTRVMNHQNASTLLDETTLRNEQISEMPSALKPKVTSINAKMIETTIPTND